MSVASSSIRKGSPKLTCGKAFRLANRDSGVAGQAVSSSTTSVAGRPQAVDVIFASPFATDSQKPVEEDLQAPLTPDQSEVQPKLDDHTTVL